MKDEQKEPDGPPDSKQHQENGHEDEFPVCTFRGFNGDLRCDGWRTVAIATLQVPDLKKRW